MHQFIQSVAIDFANAFEDTFGRSDPADEYFDPFIKLLGRSPDNDAIQSVLPGRVSELTRMLEKWLEIELDEDFVEEVYAQSLRNFYGRTD